MLGVSVTKSIIFEKNLHFKMINKHIYAHMVMYTENIPLCTWAGVLVGVQDPRSLEKKGGDNPSRVVTGSLVGW